MYPRRTAGKKAAISAGGWNAAMAAAEAHEIDQRYRQVPGRDLPILAATTIEVLNDSGEDRRRGQVLGLDDWLMDPEDDPAKASELFENPVLKGIVPRIKKHWDAFVVLPFGLGKKEIGPGILAGLAVVKIDVTNDAHRFAGVKDDDATLLKSQASGCVRILKRQSGTGEKWAIVQLGITPPKLYAVTNGVLAHAGTVNAERIRSSDGALPWERSGEIFQVHDIYFNLGESIDPGFIISVVNYEGLDVADTIYCKANDWLG
jgi:hypothetical protein